jgi:hypothetical protein
MSSGLIIPVLAFAVTGLAGLYAALRPEQYSQYFLAKWQRERISGQFEALKWVGWAIFGGCVAAILFVVLQGLRAAIFGSGGVLGAVMFLMLAAAWLWWGMSLLLRPDAFIRRTSTHLSRWIVIMFGAVLLLGGIHFGYQFVVRVRSLLR